MRKMSILRDNDISPSGLTTQGRDQRGVIWNPSELSYNTIYSKMSSIKLIIHIFELKPVDIVICI